MKYKSVFISDTHLGMKNINSKALLAFLNTIECDNLFLVGDIIDGWSFNRKKWNKTNTKIIKNILSKKLNGTNIIYIPGNHDEFMRKYIGNYNGIEIVNEYIYETNNKKYLIIHGDLFDIVMIKAKWLAKIGDVLYDLIFFINNYYNLIRWFLGKPYFSIAQFAKEKIKNVVSFIGKFETLLVEEAKRHNCDGVICGHIHHPCIKTINNFEYINCGDWIESCSAIVEDYNGKMLLIQLEDFNKL